LPDRIGELAALGTSLCFSFSSLLFTFGGREVGAFLTNRARLFFALIFVIALHWLSFGVFFPVSAAPENWFWLALSGCVGFAVGDACLFQAFVRIGPRLSSLVMSFSPALSVLLAWIVLGQALTPQDLLIVAIIIAGIVWVVSERRTQPADSQALSGDRRQHMIGLLWALGGAAGQAVGVILTKIGLGDSVPALSGTLIRLVSAFAVVWVLTILRGRFASSLSTLREHPRATRAIALGAFIGPVVGVWLTLIAVQRAPVGIASTLSSLTPIFLIPISYVLLGERLSRRAVAGTLVVFAATALLFLLPQSG
jgi:drug/metabolite transporter (DMT)-like permease